MAATSPESSGVLCSHAGTCGGCSLLHLPYSEQRRDKSQALSGLLGPILGSSDAFEPSRLFLSVASYDPTPVHFRQKVSFVFGTDPTTRDLVMGHYRRGSRQIVPVADCPVHSTRGNRIAFALRDHLRRARLAASHTGGHGVLRHVLVRTTADDAEAVAMLVVTRNDKSLRKPVRALLESTDAPDGFFVNINTNPGPFMIGEQSIRIAGDNHIRERLGGTDYLISPTAFFQTNVNAAGVLQRHVVETMAGVTRVLDLYCGSGLFALPMAATGATVVGIEENPQAIADAETNARLNRVPSARARFIAARVERALERVGHNEWDGVILDPPRQGCSDAVLEAVFQDIRPKRVTYVSCNPEALAAELTGILQCGYDVRTVRAVDMFPHTDHLEAVVTLARLD